MLNRQLKWVLIIVIIGLVAAVISYKLDLSNTCSIRQLSIAGDIKKYDKTKDSEFCDMLNKKISQFNDECKSDVEELDCG